jgi:hypothetical protein
MTAEAVAPGEATVEVVLPEGGSSLQLSCSGWSSVIGGDAVGGSPHGNFTDDADVRLAARRQPNWLHAVLTGLIANVTGKVDHQPGPLGQILTPNGMIMKRLRNSGKPGQRPGVGRCGVWEAPIQDGGHVCCCVEFATGSGCVQVEEWVLPGLNGQPEEMCSERRPRWLVGEFGDDLVGQAVEHLNYPGSNELLGRHV